MASALEGVTSPMRGWLANRAQQPTKPDQINEWMLGQIGGEQRGPLQETMAALTNEYTLTRTVFV